MRWDDRKFFQGLLVMLFFALIAAVLLIWGMAWLFELLPWPSREI